MSMIFEEFLLALPAEEQVRVLAAANAERAADPTCNAGTALMHALASDQSRAALKACGAIS